MSKLYSVANFMITYDQLTKIKRYISNSRDCVLVALNAMGILTPKMHAIASIIVDDKYVNGDSIVNVIRYKFGGKWKFLKFDAKEDFIQKLKESLRPGCMAFAGFVWSNGVGHFCMIYRDLQTGELFYMDPQVGIYASFNDPWVIKNVLDASKKMNILASTYKAPQLSKNEPLRPSFLV